MKKEVLGVDISKLTFDVYLHVNESYAQFKNSSRGFGLLLKWLKKQGISLTDLLICFEHTGMYSLCLSAYLSKNKIDFVMESAIQIKRSMGVVRGKNDKVDAKRIAEYAYLRKDKLEYTKIASEQLQSIKNLLSLRDTMVKQRASYRTLIKESAKILTKSEHQCFFDTQSKMVRTLEIQIKKIEAQIKQIIKSDTKLDQTYKLVISIKGIGPIIGAYLISTTACFTKFTNGRKYACYCGVAPFEYSSGSSVKLKTKVNEMANKKMKALLNLAARTAVVNDPELKLYYNTKVQEGKNKMSVLNVIRNKIIHRVFAVVQRGTPYVVLQNHLN